MPMPMDSKEIIENKINEEKIHKIREKMFEKGGDNNLKAFINSQKNDFLFEGNDLNIWLKRIFRKSQINEAQIIDLSIFNQEKCVIIRNLSQLVDKQILSLLFSQSYLHINL